VNKGSLIAFAACQAVGLACITTDLGYQLHPLMMVGLLVLLFPASIGLVGGGFGWVSSELGLYGLIVLCNGIAWAFVAVLARLARERRRRIGDSGEAAMKMIHWIAFGACQTVGLGCRVFDIVGDNGPLELPIRLGWQVLLFPGSILHFWKVPVLGWHVVNALSWCLVITVIQQLRKRRRVSLAHGLTR